MVSLRRQTFSLKAACASCIESYMATLTGTRDLRHARVTYFHLLDAAGVYAGRQLHCANVHVDERLEGV